MLDIEQIRKLETPEGQAEFLDLLAEVRREAGEHWLNELKDFAPELVEIADLVFNHKFEDAYDAVLAEYPSAWIFRPTLRDVHAKLNEEFDKKRF